MHEVNVKIQGKETWPRTLGHIPSPGDMLSIRAGGHWILLRVIQVWHREMREGEDSRPVIDCVEIAEADTDV